MSSDLFFALIVFALVMTVTPGPNNTMLLASGTNFGFRRTIPHMLGIMAGLVIMMLMTGGGLVRLFDAWPVSYLLMKIAGLAYMLYLAWRIATAPVDRAGRPASTGGKNGSGTGSEAGGETGRGRPLNAVEAALFQWVNPKAWAMALTALSAYTAPEAGFYGVLIVAAVFGLICLPAISVWALMGVQLRRFLADPVRLRVFNIVTAIVLVASLTLVIAPTGH